MTLDYELTLLSKDEMFGNTSLDVLKKYGTKAAISDLAIATYCHASPCNISDPNLKGNEMEDSLGANPLVEPLFNRFAHVYIETPVDSWLKWASEHNIHPAIYSFVSYKGEAVLRSEYNGKSPNADPRKWEMASNMLYKTNNPETIRCLVGEDITKEFIAFCKVPAITLENVLADDISDEDIAILNIAEKHATVMNLSQVDEENVEKVREFITKFGKEFTSLFD